MDKEREMADEAILEEHTRCSKPTKGCGLCCVVVLARAFSAIFLSHDDMCLRLSGTTDLLCPSPLESQRDLPQKLTGRNEQHDHLAEALSIMHERSTGRTSCSGLDLSVGNRSQNRSTPSHDDAAKPPQSSTRSRRLRSLSADGQLPCLKLLQL